MKIQKYILGAIAAASMGLGTSCSNDFIKEELINKQASQYFQTQEGIDGLVTGTYSALKFKFNYATWSYIMWPMGTDEFSDGNNQDPAWNGYYNLNSTNGNIANLWDNMYNRIEAANIAIKNIPLYYNKTSKFYNTRMGEALFLRAYCFFSLVQQYGGVPLKIEATDGQNSDEFYRASAKDCYAQIIKDFEEAYSLLPEKPDDAGRITKWAAAHFIAKAKLFRQSELNAEWSSEYAEADLKDVIEKAHIVLEHHDLCKDYVDLWNYTEPNGDNEKVSEVVLAAQFSNDEATWGRFGNQLHLAYPSVYQDMAGTKRDISGDREFCYLRTSNYTLDVFDRVNDSRFWKSFITTYGCNSSANAPMWPDDPSIPAGATANTPRFKGGEVGIKYIVNNAGDNEYEKISATAGEGQVKRNGVMQAPHTMVRYFKGEAEGWTTVHGNYSYHSAATQKRFVALSKFRDGARNAIASQFGTRDGIIARSAEDVLFAAEAYARMARLKNDNSYYDLCIAEINKLRDRAAYKAGEDRAKHVDGGQAYKSNSACSGKGGGYSADGAIYYETNTYFESNKLEGQEDAINAQSSLGNMLIADLNAILNSEIDNKIYNALTDKTNFGSDVTFSKVMNFILNERTRELCGEMQRWIDLSRTKALKGRWEAFNDGYGRENSTPLDDHNLLRPIPQTAYISAIINSDAASQQNPGY